MSAGWRRAVVLGSALALAGGCAVDVTQTMKRDADFQTRVFDTVAADSTLTSRLVGRLARDQGSRARLVESVLAEPDVARLTMLEIARDRTRLDGVLSLAVQDSAMKQHVLSIFQGMQMAGEAR